MVWTDLHRRSAKPGAAHQGPAFVDFLRDADASTPLSVITITDAAGAVLGVAPISLTMVDLPFRWRSRTIGRLRLKGLTVLGSEPLVAEDPDVLDAFFLGLADTHSPQVIEMESVAQNGPLWRHLETSPRICDRFHIHVHEGFRNCHSVVLPTSVNDYYRALTRKRRYNLLRQERLLHQEVGGHLELIRIQAPGTLPHLFDAMDQLIRSSPKQRAGAKAHYALLSKHDMLLCFVLRSSHKAIGVALGSRHDRTFHVHRFYHDKTLEKFSPGTTLWQMVLRNLIEDQQFGDVFMGYGEPAYRQHATNMIEARGRVLLLRRTRLNRLRIQVHLEYDRFRRVSKRLIRSKPAAP